MRDVPAAAAVVWSLVWKKYVIKIKKDIFMCPFFIFVFPKKAEYAILKTEGLQRDRVKLCQEKT